MAAKNPHLKEICIDTGNTSTFDFSIDRQQRMNLVASGMRSALQFVIKKDKQ
jgi:hypothetical protein